MATADDLESWRQRGHRVEAPERGSELDMDDRAYPLWRVSETARYCLHAAGEHLRLAQDAIRAGQLYPSAHFTVLRGGLVGAGQAVWILSPDGEGERRERGYAAIAESHRYSLAHDDELAKDNLNARDRAELHRHRTFVQQRLDELNRVRTSTARLVQTSVIATALEVTFSDTRLREVGRQFWRESSGSAHVLTWPGVSRARFTDADRRTGLSVATMGGDVEAVAEVFMCTFRLLKNGWVLYDRRCEAPT